MAFDCCNYEKALENFIFTMVRNSSDNSALTADNVKEMCVLLDISRLDIEMYNNVSDAEQQRGDITTVFDGGNADLQRDAAFSVLPGNGTVAGYRAYQYKEAPDWDENSYRRIKSFLNLIHIFCDRSRLMKIADYLAFHDKELETYNIAHFVKTVNSAIINGTIGRYDACYFNIKDFSDVNNMLGRTKATEVMKKYIARLSELLADGEAVCRMGGDNFTVIFFKDNLQKVKDYLVAADVEYGEEGRTVTIRSSAGFYDIPDDCPDVAQVMDCINAAKNVARSDMNITSVFYNDEVMQRDAERRKYESLFSKAIMNEEFQVYYQPKVSLKKYKVSGAEALCRWLHNGELIPPIKFIPVFERNKAICTLDFYMLDHVCRDIRSWLDNGRDVVKVSVNLSRCNLGEPQLVERIIATVDKYNIPHEYIEIELTETTTDVAFSELKKVVFGLQASGISTAVDDFGIGYSSLNLISDLPWNVLKIDKKFLEVSQESTAHNYLMLKHIISLAQSFGIECVVEGVETVEHVKVLKESNCYMAQGFYFDKPLPRESFEQRLALNV
ncbi:MAG: GGDEF domain-containing protein [Oscillospiraceae bacterium]|nr:GGDEF domain-containing protein [Oscillospiraceae bacterium]